MLSSVGLLYVGAVLFINGLVMLGVVAPRSAAVLNLLVGALECIIPTIMMIQANGNPTVILASSGLFLFGFTYLYVGIGSFTNLEPHGLGWFSLFVSGAAIVYAILSFTIGKDPVFSVMWLSWAVLWLLFFLVLGIERQRLTSFTGWSVILLSQPTCTIPAFLILSGNYRSSAHAAVIWALSLGMLLAMAKIISSRRGARSRTAPAASYVPTRSRSVSAHGNVSRSISGTASRQSGESD